MGCFLVPALVALGCAPAAAQERHVSVGASAGISYLLYTRDFRQELTGCVPSSLCTAPGSEFTSNAFAAQLQAGIDVAVVPHLAVTGQFRFLVPVEDPGSGHHAITAGARFVF